MDNTLTNSIYTDKGKIYHNKKVLMTLKKPTVDRVDYYCYAKIDKQEDLDKFIEQMDLFDSEIYKLDKYCQVVVDIPDHLTIKENCLGNLYRFNPEISKNWWSMKLGSLSKIVFYRFDVFGEFKEIEIVNEELEDKEIQNALNDIYDSYLSDRINRLALV